MTAPAAPLRIVLLDTETNGLPKNRYAPISEAGAWPAILQISWTEFDVTGRNMAHVDSKHVNVALHPSIAWDTGAAAVHGITEAEARTGTPAVAALGELADVLRRAAVVVAHNLDFDKSVIRAAAYTEWLRDGPVTLRDIWPRGLREFCTMRATQNLVRIPSPYYGPDSGKFKPPRLNELYMWLHGHVYDISGGILHTSRSDTHCLAQCLSKLLRRGYVVAGADGLRVVEMVSTASVKTETSECDAVS
jgi:DNA polymerase-3 subunit alpha